MSVHEILTQKLREDLTRAQAKNPAYSVRALARRLGVSPATVSGLINGKRRASPALSEKLLRGLGVPESEIETYLIRGLNERVPKL